MKQARVFLGLICIHLLIGCSGGDGQCVASIGGGCETWSQWRDNCYKITEQLPWYEAKQECIKMGGFLAVPLLDEATFLLKLYRGGFWIGCNQLDDPGIWKCQEENTEVHERNWNSGEPNSSKGNCSVIQIRGGGKWDVQKCNRINVAMCKQSVRPLLHF